jgi:hypothetical protein
MTPLAASSALIESLRESGQDHRSGNGTDAEGAQ